MPASATSVRALLATTGVVLVAGAALAVAKPGNLGDDDADSTAAPTSTTATTVAGGATTTSVLGDPSATTVTLPGEGTSTTIGFGASTTGTTAAGGGGGVTSTTTGPGSGLGNDGASVADDATATTGMDSLLGPGLVLLAAAGLARSAARRREL